MQPEIVIRCNFCDTELKQMRVSVDSVTGATTIYVGECKPCLDEAYEEGVDSACDDED